VIKLGLGMRLQLGADHRFDSQARETKKNDLNYRGLVAHDF
jgi:hypothetical protein